MNKRVGRTELRAKYIAVAVAAAFAPWSAYGQTPPPNQLPNLTVTQGLGQVNAPVGNFLQVDQFSQRAIFSGSMTMGSAGHMNVSQPGSSAIGLFRDVSGSLTQIFGRITANGQIFISNQNGVLFGSTARVEVGGLFASSLSINDNDFMEGRYNWYNDGATGTVTNQGTIITPSGYTVLAGPQVRNDGIIVARTGSVVLAAGDRVSLDLIGDGLISVSVDQAALNASAVNTGTIEAEGGKVVLTARSANALLDTVVNAGGAIRANSLFERNGEIVLDGGGAGMVAVSGRHEAGSATVSGAAITINGTITTGPGTGSQTITTPGALTVEADTAGDAGLLHNGSGAQHVAAGNLDMRGGTGTDSRAIITSGDAAADQSIAVAGDLTMTGGSAGTRNLAIIRAFGEQTVAAGNLTMAVGSGGADNAAVIVAPRQTITTTGDARLSGGGSFGNAAARIGGLSIASAGANTPTDLQLNVGNDLVLTGGPGPNNAALIGSTAGQPQNIRIQAGRDVVLGATGNSIARIGTGSAPTPGDVTVIAARDVQVNGSGEILSGGTIAVTAGRAVNVNATSTAAFTARISSTTGQTIDAQSVTVTAQNSRLAQIVNTTVGEQRITTTGNVEIQTLGPGGGTAEIRNGAGLQTLNVGGEQLTLRGMGSGMANIASSGDQTINMTASGPKSITVGDHAAQGTSTISSSGDQKILGYADITVTGGSGPVANGSNASILATNPTRTQRIEARNLSLANSILGGNNSVAGIQGANQNIHALGNVTLTANASGGTLPGVRIGGLAGAGATATNLVLTVGGDLVLTASNTTANNGVGIGSTAAPGPAFANNISIDAGGNVILNGGTTEGSGARIGSSASTGAAPGDINIAADGAIVLNGGTQAGAIRTQGDVTLEAASISEGTNGLIVANTLTTATTGVTNLTGSNEIVRFNGTSGDALTLVDAGSLQVSGISTTNDTITLTTDSLTNSGVISNGGGSSTANVVLNADAFNLAGGTIEGGAAAVVLRPRTGTNSFGIEAAGATTLSNADIASIQTDNFIIFGSSTGTVFTGNMTIGENARVEGHGKNLAFSRSLAPGAEMITIGSQGVATTGDVIIGAGGGGIRSNGGTVTGDEVVLRATNGIGTPTARVKTAANALALNQAGGGGVFVSELDNVTLRTISLNAGGPLTVSNINNGSVSLISGGDVNVAGLVSSGGSMILDAGGNLNLDGTAVDAVLVSNGGQAVTARSINMTAANGRRANIENVNGNQTVTATAGGISLQVPGSFGVAQIVNTSNLFPGDQTVSAAGQIDVLGGAVSPVGPRNSGIFKNGPGGLQTVRASGITLQGASTGISAGALISSQGNQLVDVTGGTINLRGGNGGTGNSATIGAAATGQQTIRAHDINLSNGFGGTDTIAGIVGGHQLIDATGSVTLTAQGSLVSSGAPTGPGVRIGAPSGSTTGTDLTLLVGGNLVINGGSAANNGASIGSSGAGVAQQNTIVIDAGGSVILNSGSAPETGARIGSSSQNGLAGGNISIQAGGAIALNGTGSETAIRTLGNVTLDAASVSESSNGFVLANTLNVITDGAANLAGPNDVARFNASTGGSLTFIDAGGLRVTGVSTTNDTVTLTTDSLVNEGMITNGGSTSTANIVLNADSFNLAGGTVEGGAAAVILRPRTGTNSFGIESAGQTTLTNADIAAIHTSDFVVFGSGMGTTFTGNMTIGQNARVEGGDKNLAFLRSSVPGGTTTIGANGVSTAGDVIVSAGGGAILSNGGTVSGDQVQLRASQGIGSQFMRVQTSANRLALNNTGPQGAFVSELNDVTLGNVNLTVGGIANNVANVIGGGGAYDVTAGGSITVSDLVQAGSVALATPSGSIVELGSGAIVANSLTTSSARETSLTGANQVASFNGSTAFGAPSGDITLNNTGALAVTALSAGNNATLTNNGAVSVTGGWFSFGETDIATTGGNLTVMSSLSSGRAMAVDVGGTLTVSANGPQTAQLITNNGGQTIRAQAVEVVAQNGGSATITNIAGGEQRITISGAGTSPGLDVHTRPSGGFAQVFQQAGGFAQTIEVSDADHINVNGAGPSPFPGSGAAISTVGGVQTVSITGSGANAITLGSQGGLGDSRIGGGQHQIVTAGAEGERGSITIVGPDANSRLAGFVSTPVGLGGTQTVSTTGTLRVQGGRGSQSSNFQSGVFHNGSGAQTVNAGRIELQGGSTGVNNGAFINSGGGGNPANVGNQYITVTGDIVIAAGAGGGASIAGGLPSTQQIIHAHNIDLSNAVGGTNSFASIRGGQQEIHVTGDVTLRAFATNGTDGGVRIGGLSPNATDLDLYVGRDLILTGGSAADNNANIGSTGNAGVFNRIYIETGRDVVLNSGSGSGARIGSGNTLGDGNIEIHAGRNIELNGVARATSIRTLGSVILEAASITEASNGSIIADSLTTTTTGATSLIGPNQISRVSATSGGPLALIDSGTLQVTGITTSNDTITLTTDSLTNSGVITNGGPASTANIVFNADAFNLAGGTIEGGAAAVILRPRTGTNSFGIESAGQTTLTNADIASIHTSDFVVFGSGMGTTFTGNMAIGQSARVEGGDKNLAFFRSSVPGGTTTVGAQGVNTTGNVIVSAGGGAIVSEGGTVSGDQVQLRASQGIGSQFMRVQTAASRLALNNTGSQGAFVFETGDVTLGNVNLTVGGIANNVANVIGGGGSYDVLAAGSITVADLIQAGSVALGTSSGSITEVGAGAIVANDLRTFSGQSTLLGGDNQVANFSAQAANVLLNNRGVLNVNSLNASGFATLTNAGAVTVNGPWNSSATSITTTGPGADLSVNDSFISAVGPMTINVSGALAVNATSQNAGLASFGPGATQDITAHAIGLTAQNGFRANIENFGVGQRITTTAGDLNLQVPGAFGVAQIVNFGGAQTIDVAGQLNVLGGVISPTPTGFRNSGIFNNVPGGQQNVTAAGITLQGASSGTMAGALIVSQGDQFIDVTGGSISLIGGSGGVSNSATIGASATGQQTILAHDINLSNGFGGTDTIAGIVGGHQTIDATGDVTLTAQGSLVSPGGTLPGVRIGAPGGSTTGTDLTMRAGGNVVLNGGAAGNGASIGSSGAGTARQNTILIDAGGSVILNSGSAPDASARIGSSVQNGLAGGNITIIADGGIALNGTTAQTAIRTLDTVTLVADHITEAANGFIVAGTLNTVTQGDQTLTGPNQVASFTASSDHGNVALTNTSAVLSLGAMDLPGNLAIVQTGDVTLGSATASSATLISAAGDLSMSASGQIVVRGSDTTAGAGAAVLAGGGLDFSAGDVTLLAGDAALTPVVVRGGDGVEMTLGNELRVTGGRGLLSPALLTSGGDIELTIGRAVRVDAGTGFLSVARVQTETKDGVIRLVFPELSHGGYFVNGVEGRISQGQTGFYSLLKPAKVGKTLLLDYGN